MSYSNAFIECHIYIHILGHNMRHIKAIPGHNKRYAKALPGHNMRHVKAFPDTICVMLKHYPDTIRAMLKQYADTICAILKHYLMFICNWMCFQMLTLINILILGCHSNIIVLHYNLNLDNGCRGNSNSPNLYICKYSVKQSKLFKISNRLSFLHQRCLFKINSFGIGVLLSLIIH